ncbi:eukaryotic type KH-domain type I [Hysterangium stoloniferum]|nr:eukaryotic type KH-domain type I [Hysterangium stoloniferum]
MSSKRKWDQQAVPDSKDGESPTKIPKTDDNTGKTATEAAAAAAAIAAKIAAQFASPSALAALGGDPSREIHDGEFTKDIEINDVRNRYMLTKGATQQQIHDETGASVTTKGVWYPDKSKATEKDPPLYLHVTAATKESLEKGIQHINELIALDMGSLVEDKKGDRRERRKWPEEKIPVGLDTLRNFNVRAKVVGPAGMFVKHIQQETGTRVQIKGLGSGFVDAETGRESDEPMHIHITGPDELQLARAKNLTDDLLEVVRAEHAKARSLLQQQQMELHQAQMQYAAYSSYTVRFSLSFFFRVDADIFDH